MAGLNDSARSAEKRRKYTSVTEKRILKAGVSGNAPSPFFLVPALGMGGDLWIICGKTFSHKLTSLNHCTAYSLKVGCARHLIDI
jgi:hypothetical protein